VIFFSPFLQFTDVPKERTAPALLVHADTVLGVATATATPPMAAEAATSPPIAKMDLTLVKCTVFPRRFGGKTYSNVLRTGTCPAVLNQLTSRP
jgi:hypothetical protein